MKTVNNLFIFLDGIETSLLILCEEK